MRHHSQDFERLEELQRVTGNLPPDAPATTILKKTSPAEAFDEGITLLVSERGETERLRVEFKPAGESRWLGTKKGLSVRMREIADVQAALGKAIEQAR